MVITLFTLTVIALYIMDRPNAPLPFLMIKDYIHCGT